MSRIKDNFLSFKPTVIAVELDVRRAQSLLAQSQQKMSVRQGVKELGVQGFLFVLIAQFIQRKIGRIVGITPGSDMKYAMELARNNNLRVSFVDRPIQITVRRLFKKITWKEKLRLPLELLTAPFKKKQRMKIDVHSIPAEEQILILLSEMKRLFPTMYTVLLSERNVYIARKVARLLKTSPEDTVLVVVGAGHKTEVERLIPYYSNRIEVV